MSKHLLQAALACSLICGAGANAAQIDVTVLQPTVTFGGGWGVSTTGAGTASLVDLTGTGGNLENNLPMPVGAALLTTGSDNNDRAGIGIADNFGDAITFLGKLEAAYSYFKVATAGNAFAAP